MRMNMAKETINEQPQAPETLYANNTTRSLWPFACGDHYRGNTLALRQDKPVCGLAIQDRWFCTGEPPVFMVSIGSKHLCISFIYYGSPFEDKTGRFL